MSNNHLTYFKVENFKKFDTLEVKNIGQFNLIVGDNNVGKTCLLEALTINERFKTTISYFSQLLVKRNLKTESFFSYKGLNIDENFKNNEIALYQRDLNRSIKFSINETRIEIQNLKEKIKESNNVEINKFVEEVDLFSYGEIIPNSSNWIVFKLNDEIKFLADITSEYYSDFLTDKKTVPAVMLSEKVENYLTETYSLIYGKLNYGEKVSEVLNLIFPDVKVIDLRIFDNIGPFNRSELLIKTVNKNEYHSIREYGEGFIRCLHFIFLILANQSTRICIDEIDTGIHHTKLKKNWEIIFKLCKELEVQLFATTHSKECIEAFIGASNEVEKDIIRLIELKDYKSKIYANTLNYESIITSLESDVELRGGDLF
ncbi:MULTISPECIES: AAA family ATPase [Flavobacterium]|uniref:AAA family ATPase n=1 Tax=Flavobacterium covae TaxID=2906076 RepID=A0ABW8PDS5_9FLAO|nr:MULTISPECIES: AAA family ATPase [Flavobacterium]